MCATGLRLAKIKGGGRKGGQSPKQLHKIHKSFFAEEETKVLGHRRLWVMRTWHESITGQSDRTIVV